MWWPALIEHEAGLWASCTHSSPPQPGCPQMAPGPMHPHLVVSQGRAGAGSGPPCRSPSLSRCLAMVLMTLTRMAHS